MRLLAAIPLVFTLGLQGCASTDFHVTGKQMPRPICSTSRPNVSAVVYWATNWRENQKEPTVREEMARRGIAMALGSATCLSVLELKQVSSEQASKPSAELINLIHSSLGQTDLIVTIEVRELGPTLEIGIPVFIRGGTEVRIDVRVIEVASNRMLAQGQSHWSHGGSFVIKGVKTLEVDMASALLMSLGLENTPEDG